MKKPIFDEDESFWHPVPKETTVADDWAVLVLDNGRKILTFGKHHQAGDSVHVLDADDTEKGMWDNREWHEEPEGVMGAILRLAGGARA